MNNNSSKLQNRIGKDLFRYDTDYYNEFNNIKKIYDIDNFEINDTEVKCKKYNNKGFVSNEYKIIGVYDKNTYEWTWGWALNINNISLLLTDMLNHGLVYIDKDYISYRLLLITGKFKVYDSILIDIIMAINVTYFKTVIIPLEDKNRNSVMYIYIINDDFKLYK